MEKTKNIIIVSFTLLWVKLGILAIPLLMLVVMNLTDYFTGMAAAVCVGKKLSSKESFRGIVKKVCMYLLVLIGSMLDWLLLESGQTFGIETKYKFLIAAAVCMWLICNEIISILENMVNIGVKIPPFLLPLVKHIKKKVEDSTNEDK